jgi:predicted RND superfamily exporter protein
VDYTIHVQLSLRRHAEDIAAVCRTTGRALLLCAGTTIAAFGSLAWSSNAGLASLGTVCAVGVACMLVTALCFLPAWRYAARRHRSQRD